MATKIKNWKKFQHFKDRRPPWIKIYRDILDDRDIMMISDSNFAFLVKLWLLASEDKSQQGIIPTLENIAFRLRMKKDSVVKCLEGVNEFLIRDDVEMISTQYQGGPSEREREEEGENTLSSKLDRRRDNSDIVLNLFTYWQEQLKHPQARLDASRRKVIAARLKEGYEPERIKQAIRGIKSSPHHMGQNDRNTRYDDIELICRNGKNIDRFADMDGGGQCERDLPDLTAEYSRSD